MSIRSLALVGASLAMCVPAMGFAQTDPQPAAQRDAEDAYARFVPKPGGQATRLDFTFLDDALRYMVLTMGPSTRQGMSRPRPPRGTRMVYGHESRVRLEGNRIIFSLLDENATAPLTAYREDLERLGSEIDIAALPRTEQLAYWLNLHNVAVIEQIARNYPVKSPSRMKLGDGGTPLDTTRFINVAGVALSPQDIRTKIVFPNWDNPDVIYGFFRGEVGGPSIQKRAYNGAEVEAQLVSSGGEFVNSLRGVEGWSDNLLVSKIYEEAAPFYFPALGDDFRDHLLQFANEEVSELIESKSTVKFADYEDTIADLVAGEREPGYYASEDARVRDGVRITPSLARFMGERYEKLEKLRREGKLVGKVIVLPPGPVEPAEDEPAPQPQDEPAAVAEPQGDE